MDHIADSLLKLIEIGVHLISVELSKLRTLHVTNSDALFWPVTLLQLCYPSSGQADHYLSLSQQTFFGLITRYPKCPSEEGTPFTSECKVG